MRLDFPRKIMSPQSFWEDFKEFALRGNVIGMALGVVLGTSFGNIVSSLVKDVISPLLTLLVGDGKFQPFSFTVRSAEYSAGGTLLHPAIKVEFGTFLQTIVNFLLIALSLFLFLRLIGGLRRLLLKIDAPIYEREQTEKQLLTDINKNLVALRKAIESQSSSPR
jgi:large conductance mechanosensitive channel